MAGHFFNTVEDNITGKPVNGATILVYEAGATISGDTVTSGTLADIFSDDGISAVDQANIPVTSDARGFFEFWTEETSVVIEISYGGAPKRAIDDVEILGGSISSDVTALSARVDAAETVTQSALIVDLAAMTDPDDDQIVFWDDSAGDLAWLDLGSGLSISGTTISVDALAGSGLADPNADRIRFWDDSAGTEEWLTPSTGLSLSGTSLAVDMAADTDIWTGTSVAKAITPDALFDAAAPQTLTSSSNATPVDMGAGINFNLSLDEDSAVGNPTNAKVGQSGRIRIADDGTGGWDLTWGANWSFVDADPAITTTASAVYLFAYFVNATDDIELSYLGELA